MFDIRDAEILTEIVRSGGFRAAAQRLNLTQSAVSARVARIERRLGLTLFDRAGRGVRLTLQGRAFLDQAERLIAMRNGIVAGLAPGADFAGTLRIGVSETIVHTWLPGMLTRLNAALPALRLELSVDTSPELGRRLGAREIDVAVMMRGLAPPRARRWPVFDCPLRWYARPDPALPSQPLTPADLARLPLITFARGTLPHAELERRLPPDALPAPLIHACASLATTLHLTRAGFGIGLLPRPMVREDLARGLLVALKADPAATMADLAFDLACLPEQPEALVTRLRDMALAAAAALPGDHLG
jgi:DNA-binding transcriptional LysR family regulator